MGYIASFQGWKDVTIGDLLVAYRKAKADSYFENTFPSAIRFADYEQDLLGNLSNLLELLKSNEGFSKNKSLLGEIRLLPKKLSMQPKPESTIGHVHFSDAELAFDHIKSNNDLIPEFRVVGDFPVDSHIISALWINMVGHKLDAKLEDTCYGARLRRVINDDVLDKNAEHPFHIRAIGSFDPYFQPYQNWRNDGLKVIRDELEKDHHIIAASMDLKSYYHYIDPLAFSNHALYSELGVELTEEEFQFTQELSVFLDAWSVKARQYCKSMISHGDKDVDKYPAGGLVIGLTVSRVLSNVLLHKWDKAIRQNVTPIHYGRYVDDMFFVLRDTENIKNANDFMEFLRSRIGQEEIYKGDGVSEKNSWYINFGKKYQSCTEIKLQAEKQKLFVLHGQAGLDLLDSIEKDIYELSSEHRLMPAPDQLEHSTAARVLSASGSVGEKADTLRRADGLTIQRLSWALQLRHVETLAQDLPPAEWKEHRDEFYQFAHTHILRPDNIFAHFTYLPRLLGFAISLNEWDEAELIVNGAYAAIDQLREAVSDGGEVGLNGRVVPGNQEIWRYIKATMTWMFIDSASRYYDPNKLLSDKRTRKEKRLAELFLYGILDGLSQFADIFEFEFGAEDFYEKAPLIAMADLAKVPYKNILASRSADSLLKASRKENNVVKEFGSIDLIEIDDLKKFLNTSRARRLSTVKGKRQGESLLPYLFPTRPLTPAEIAELAPECVGLNYDRNASKEKPSKIWAKYTQAVRGVWVKPTLLAEEQDGEKSPPGTLSTLKIGTEKKSKVVVALTNIKTEDDDWAKCACKKPNLTLERYQSISELVNQAIKLKHKPDYMLFPELSVPLKWIKSISGRLMSAGISLIAGTEYRHFPGNKLYSEACLVLTDNRLGFPASVKIWQPKLNPAVGEEKDLISKFGKEWAYNLLGTKTKQLKKPVYIHNGVHFGVMVCSELQNSKARVEFQGNVDALMVLSWNQDLETFSSLIEASALDVHAYSILVNNRKYGDSRVRSPSKESYLRDIARIKGGDNDFVVAATIDIDALRAFQSRAKRWPYEGDRFKPVPEGYKILESRKKIPPK